MGGFANRLNKRGRKRVDIGKTPRCEASSAELMIVPFTRVEKTGRGTSLV